MTNKTDKLTVKGRVKVLLNNKVVREVDNLVVTVGKNWITSRIQGVVDGVMSHIAIGTGVTAAAAGDTALQTEVARGALTTSGGTAVANVITFETFFAADVPNVTAPATTPITEAGIFNDPTTGSMLAHTIFTVVQKGELDTLTISWEITIS